MYIHISIAISLSLSLYIYIYIYTYVVHPGRHARKRPKWTAFATVPRGDPLSSWLGLRRFPLHRFRVRFRRGACPVAASYSIVYVRIL